MAADFVSFSMAYAFVHQVLPAALAAVVACGVWLWFCRWFYRVEERAWREALDRPDSHEAASLEARIELLAVHRSIAGKGSPADRLFFAGVAGSSVVSLFALATYWPR